MTKAITPKHPRGLYLLFTVEMWERFNFYGMRALLTLFLVSAISFTEKDASLIYGAYLGLSYLTPMIGGYIADNIWGCRKSIVVGGFIMSIGQMAMFVSASTFQQNIDVGKIFLWTSISMLVVGNGFFKPNISSMVGKLYPPADTRLDAAYTIFYMGINIGGALGMLICSFLGDIHDAAGVRVVSAFKWGFLVAGVAMMLGTIIFVVLKNKYLKTSIGQEIGIAPKTKTVSKQQTTIPPSFSSHAIITAIIGFLVLLTGFYFLTDGGLVKFIYSLIYSGGICLACFVYFGDKSLTKVERDKILVLYIVCFFVIFFWACFEQAGASLTFIADYQTDRNILGTDIPPSAVQSVNSIFIIALAIPFALLWTWMDKNNIRLIAPAKQAIGLVLLAIGYLIVALQVKDLGIAGKMGVIWLIIMYLLHTMGELCLSPVGLSLVSKLSPTKFVSLLMGVWFLANASGYALGGVLGSVIPPTGDKYLKAEKLGIVLEDVLTKKIILTPQQQQVLVDEGVPLSYPSFMGMEIHDLFDFFMLFVLLSLVAGIILFLISPKLKKMMHGVI